MLRVRFDKTMHVIGWYGDYSSDKAIQQAIDFVHANTNRKNRKPKTNKTYQPVTSS